MQSFTRRWIMGMGLNIGALLGLVGCQTTSVKSDLLTAPYVDLERFMGEWYVIASIPTWFERDAFAATETYHLTPEGRIETTFRYRKGGLEGPAKALDATATVRNTTSNAVWDMQFLWPFQADYRIMMVDEGYQVTVIGREQRDYAWIMARNPEIPEDDYQRLVDLIASQGYDIRQIRRVPQLSSQPQPQQ